jgi:hypothetical protein
MHALAKWLERFEMELRMGHLRSPDINPAERMRNLIETA